MNKRILNAEEFAKEYRNNFDIEIKNIVKEQCAGKYHSIPKDSDKVLYKRLSIPIFNREQFIIEEIRNRLDNECLQLSETGNARLVPFGNIEEILDEILKEIEGKK
jgi:hypothetical protein